jgi:hypothetical protein
MPFGRNRNFFGMVKRFGFGCMDFAEGFMDSLI